MTSVLAGSIHTSTVAASNAAANTSNANKPESPRLRASCDGCYLSKIKCSKETPKCSRCSTHGIPCKYSPSQRIGNKRRIQFEDAKKDTLTQARESGPVDGPIAQSPIDASMRTPLFDWSVDLSSFTAGPASTQDGEFDGLLQAAWQNSLPSSDASSECFADMLNHTSNYSSPHQFMTPVDFNRGLRCSNPTPTAHALYNARLTQPTPPQQHPLAGETMKDKSSSSSMTAFDLGEVQSTNFPPDMQLEPPTIASCNCSTIIFEVLRTLHERSSDPQVPFDAILATGKEVIARISPIWECSGVLDPGSVMTLAAVMAKMMAWYRSIFCSVTSARPPADSTSTPITLGAYRLDGADEESVKRQVTLNELRKLDGLVARISQTSGHTQQEARFYGDLVLFLRRRLREIVEELQRDLRMEFAYEV